MGFLNLSVIVLFIYIINKGIGFIMIPPLRPVSYSCLYTRKECFPVTENS